MTSITAASASGRSHTRRLLMASIRHDRLRILLVAAILIAASVAAAVLTPPRYMASSTLLVLLGSEYTYRGVAGENVNVTSALDREQILRTEIEIMDADDLHRDVIRGISVERLYPELLAPPSALSQFKASILGKVDEVAGTPKPPVDPVQAALQEFNAHLNLQAVRAGNTIELSFTHPDPEIAALVLRRLEDAYLKRRRELYLSREAAVVGEQVAAIRAQLEAADTDLARFKTETKISDYQERRTILLGHEGALETDLRNAESQTDQSAARISQLTEQMRNLPGAYRTVQNPLMLQIQEDLAAARGDQRAARAQAARARAQLEEVVASLGTLNGREKQIIQLERARSTLEDKYKAAAKVQGDRQVTESVEMSRQANVRVLQEPVIPSVPEPLRILVVAAGTLLAALSVPATALGLHFLRRVYLLPEALEVDTGLRVLSSVPDTDRFTATEFALRPS